MIASKLAVLPIRITADNIPSIVYFVFDRPEDRTNVFFDAIKRKRDPVWSDKQKRIAALAGNPDEIDAADLAALRAGKKGKLSIETAISEMDGIIEGVLDSIKKKV